MESNWGGGSLLECRLPRNLTLVISCISEKSLNKRDRKRNVPCYFLQSLLKQDTSQLLKQLLHNRGRLLCEEDEQIILSGLPKETTPLYVQLLCRQLQNMRGFDNRLLMLSVGTEESISIQLKALNSNYSKLYYHTIGYLALTVDGLSEQELLTLLERDEQVLQEVKAHTHWEIKQGCYTLSVLWARIYYDLKDYLSEVDSNGILLLRFHHDLVHQTVREMIGEEVLMQLSRRLSGYFLA